jgi:uncharacterized repeat protein (TIGR01451 family)
VTPAVDVVLGQEGQGRVVMLGQEVEAVVGVTNLGPSVATGLVVTNEVAAGVSVVRAEGSQGTNEVGSGWVRFDLGELGVGSNAVLRVVLRGEAVGVGTNRAWGWAAEAELEGTNNVAEQTVETVPAADLALALAPSPALLPLGRDALFELALTNLGPSDASGVWVTNQLPAGVSLVSVTSSQGTPSIDGTTIGVDLGTLPSQGVATLQITFRPEEPGSLTIQASAGASEADPLSVNNQVQAVAVVRREANLGLQLSTADSLVPLGREVLIRVEVTNAGPHDATSVVVEDSLPQALSLVSVDLDQGSWSRQGDLLRMELGTVPAGARAQASLRMQASTAERWTNEARATTADLDPVGEDDTAGLEGAVLPFAQFALSAAARPEPVMVGDQLHYTIEITNLTAYDVPDVTLKSALPADAAFVSASVAPSGNWSQSGGSLVFDLGAMPAGASATASVVVTPTAAGSATNLATLGSAFLDPALPSPTAVAVSRVVAEPPLTAERAGNRLLVSWPAVAEGYVLQGADRIGPDAAWTDDQNPQVLVDDRVTVSVKVVGQEWFYRLIRR